MRKRVSKRSGSEPYPARTPALRALDRIMVYVAIIAPFILLPQVLRVFEDGDISGLSLLTWVLAGFHNLIWVVYGVAHKDWPISVSSALMGVLDFLIVLGILIYT